MSARPSTTSPQAKDTSQKEQEHWQAEVLPLHPDRHDKSAHGPDLPNGFVFQGNRLCAREGANKRGNSPRLTQSFHFSSLSRSFLP